ncbi:MAG: DCC1-like thiol-disulfide oxidoreductase family protein [Bacteroidota bacterium]
MKTINNKSFVLFDGYCNLCNASVRFIIKRDKKQQYIFSSLQSDAAQKVLLQYGYNYFKTNSIILIENEKVYDKSTAALRIAKDLKPLWNYAFYLIYIPKSIRDRIYDLIAKNRYKWFGKKDNCTVNFPLYENRFL